MIFNYAFFSYIYLFYLCISQVFCIFEISNINILDDYYNNPLNFMDNQPIIDGITLILPQQMPVRENLRPISHIWQPFRPSIRARAPPYYREQSDKEFKSPQKAMAKRKRKRYKNGNKFVENTNESDYEKSSKLFDNSPPYSIPNQFNFHEPIMSLTDAKSKTNDSPKQVITSPKSFNAKRKRRPKLFRTATANQLSHKKKDNNQNTDNEQSITNDEKPFASDDPNHYPHQYAIEIRWKNENNEFYDPNAPSGDHGEREMHTSKDFEHAKHRLFEHKEEEHWHEKKWLNEGLKRGYINGKSVPIHIVRPSVNIESNANFNPMPKYAQPMPDGSTLREIDEHFAIPTPGFRVNNRFINWAQNTIDLSQPQSDLSADFGMYERFGSTERSNKSKVKQYID